MANEFASYKGVSYSNGRLPAKFKVRLDGNNLDIASDPAVLREDAGNAWNRARAEVKAKTGIDLTVRGWNRSLADQEKFFFERYKRGKYSPFNDYRWYKGVKYGRTNGAAAAIPGTSNHGLGTTVDVVDFGSVGNFNHPRRVKAIAILKRHGWDDTEGRGKIQEPWHLNYIPAQDKHKNDKPDTTPQEGFLMTLSHRDQEALLWTTRENKKILEEVRSLLKAKIKDGKGAATPRDIQERTLDVSRRDLANGQETLSLLQQVARWLTPPTPPQ